MSFSLVLRKAELENPLCMSRHMLYLSPTQPPSPLQISSVRTFVSMCSKIDGNHQCITLEAIIKVAHALCPRAYERVRTL